jgi:hypothetical protein
MPDDGSPVSREAHAGIYERRGLQCPRRLTCSPRSSKPARSPSKAEAGIQRANEAYPPRNRRSEQARVADSQ